MNLNGRAKSAMTSFTDMKIMGTIVIRARKCVQIVSVLVMSSMAYYQKWSLVLGGIIGRFDVPLIMAGV